MMRISENDSNAMILRGCSSYHRLSSSKEASPLAPTRPDILHVKGFYKISQVIFRFVFIAALSRFGGRGGPMVSALDSESKGPGSNPSRGNCVVFLGKTLYSHSVSLHPGV